MNSISERQRNHAAFRQLKDTLAKSYAPGQFIAIAGGQVVADAPDLDALRSLLRALGKDPSEVLTVQAGVDYPETAVILSQDGRL